MTYSREPINPCSSPPHSPIRTVRRSLRPDCFRIRIASIITADPAALSVAPVDPCQESKCAPSITTSSALSVPGISPTTLNDAVSPSWNVFLISRSIFTGMFFCSARTMRP